MAINANVVRVLANPYSFIDHEGEPQGVYPDDPDITGGSRRFAGAEFDLERTRVTETFKEKDPRRASQVAEPQTTKFRFSAEPVVRPMTKHYRDGIRTGAIIACDEASAAFASLKDFLPPATALARERTRAEAAWRANYGDRPHAFPPAKPETKTRSSER